jgi:hypothetical protein
MNVARNVVAARCPDATALIESQARLRAAAS